MNRSLSTAIIVCFFSTTSFNPALAASEKRSVRGSAVSESLLRNSDVKLDENLVDQIKSPNNPARYLKILEVALPDPLTKFLTNKLDAGSTSTIAIERQSSNFFLIKIDRMRIPLQLLGVDESGTVNFKINGRSLGFNSGQSPEEVWNMVVASLPNPESKHSLLQLILPDARAVPVGGVVLVAAAIAVVGLVATLTNAKICQTYEMMNNLCEDPQATASDIFLVAKIDNVKFNPMRLARCKSQMNTARACIKKRGLDFEAQIPETLKEYFGVTRANPAPNNSPTIK